MGRLVKRACEWARAGVSVLSALATVSALAGQPTRTWEFYLSAPGTYKLQVEHPVADAPGTKVSYTVSLGAKTKTREFELVTNRPFIPLVTDVAAPQKMRVSVTGLPDLALKQTRVYAYNADYIPYWEYFDPAKDQGLEDIDRVRKLLDEPADRLDLGRFKLAIDKLVNPGVDVVRASKELDEMIRNIKTMPDYGSRPTSRATALQRFIYSAGPWNGNRPFEYDLDDPLGSNPDNKLLTTYLSSRKGNCVTMPLLFVILGERLGLNLTLATAPNHLLVKFRNELGTWLNLEATSGAHPAREVWIRQQSPSITDKAMENGVYLHPLTKKEAAAVVAGLLAEKYFREEQYQRVIAVVDLLLEYYPKDVSKITMKGAAYGRLARQYQTERMSASGQSTSLPTWYHEHLFRGNHAWFNKAERLGWREESKDEKQRYLDLIRATKKGD